SGTSRLLFQAEDGIRDFRVTGVQTCALPICISRPVHEVFEAVADPAKLSGYFTTGGAQGRLETGATVTWDFHDFPGAFPVHVVEVVPDQRIVLRWEAPEDGDPAGTYETIVTMRFEAIEAGRTLVQIHEAG